MASEFSSPEIALTFLDNERGDDDARMRRREVAAYAKQVLESNGELLALRMGRFEYMGVNRRESKRGIQTYRGTVPIEVGDSHIALRQGFRDMEHTGLYRDRVYLVKTPSASGNYLLDVNPDVISVLNPASKDMYVPLHVPSLEGPNTTDHQIDAVTSLIQAIEYGTSRLPTFMRVGLDSPVVLLDREMPYGVGSVIFANQTDKIPYYDEILAASFATVER